MYVIERWRKVAVLILMLLFFYFSNIGCEIKKKELSKNYVEGIVNEDKEVLRNCTVHLGSHYYTKPRSNGHFYFSDVKEGVYHLFVNHPYYEFNRYLVEIKKKITKGNYATYTVLIYDFYLPFDKSNLMVSSVIFDKKGVYEFLIPTKSFNLFKLIKSPIFLVFIFFIVMLFLLPHMQKISESSREEAFTEASYKSKFIEAVRSSQHQHISVAKN